MSVSHFSCISAKGTSTMTSLAPVRFSHKLLNCHSGPEMPALGPCAMTLTVSVLPRQAGSGGPAVLRASFQAFTRLAYSAAVSSALGPLRAAGTAASTLDAAAPSSAGAPAAPAAVRAVLARNDLRLILRPDMCVSFQIATRTKGSGHNVEA